MKKTMFLVLVAFLLTQATHLWATDVSQVEHTQTTRLEFTKQAVPLHEQVRPLNDEPASKQNLDLDKINSVGDKSLEYFDQVETSLTCLEEQLTRLTAETKKLRQHIDRLKFVVKNHVTVEKKVEPLVVKPVEVINSKEEKQKELFIKSEEIKKEEMKKEKEQESLKDETVE